MTAALSLPHTTFPTRTRTPFQSLALRPAQNHPTLRPSPPPPLTPTSRTRPQTVDAKTCAVLARASSNPMYSTLPTQSNLYRTHLLTRNRVPLFFTRKLACWQNGGLNL